MTNYIYSNKWNKSDSLRLILILIHGMWKNDLTDKQRSRQVNLYKTYVIFKGV